jgi:hypothetical protein
MAMIDDTCGVSRTYIAFSSFGSDLSSLHSSVHAGNKCFLTAPSPLDGALIVKREIQAYPFIPTLLSPFSAAQHKKRGTADLISLSSSVNMSFPDYKGYRFPPEMISHTVWLYLHAPQN